MGESAATALFDRIDGDQAPPRRTVIPTTLVTRGGLATPA
jgi:DNA-binding LacI/PurR family transcriptional regulator